MFLTITLLRNLSANIVFMRFLFLQFHSVASSVATTTEEKMAIIRLTVQEYASQMHIDKSTVYRHIKAGKLQTENVDGTLCVLADSSQFNAETTPLPLIKHLMDENEWLQQRVEALEKELNESRQQFDEARQRSDTIILQLTRQFEQQTLLLEDMRQQNEQKKSSLFRRLFFKEKSKK